MQNGGLLYKQPPRPLHRAIPRWPAGFPVLAGALQFGTAWAGLELSPSTNSPGAPRGALVHRGDEPLPVRPDEAKVRLELRRAGAPCERRTSAAGATAAGGAPGRRWRPPHTTPLARRVVAARRGRRQKRRRPRALGRERRRRRRTPIRGGGEGRGRRDRRRRAAPAAAGRDLGAVEADAAVRPQVREQRVDLRMAWRVIRILPRRHDTT